MTEYTAVSRDGSIKLFAAYTYSDAYQQAFQWAESRGGLLTFD